jgi:hypothetical protein
MVNSQYISLSYPKALFGESVFLLLMKMLLELNVFNLGSPLTFAVSTLVDLAY